MKIGLHFYFEGLAFVVALLCYRKMKGSFMVWFIPYLAVVLGIEWGCIVLDSHGRPTATVYNMATLVYSAFYTYIFMSLAENKKHKRALFWVNMAYMLFYCVYATAALQWSARPNQDLLVAGFIEMIVFSCLFFYQCLRDDYDTSGAKYRSGLWIAAGVLTFYCGMSFCYSLYPYIVKHDLRMQGRRLYTILPRYLCITLYGCLSISFLVWKKQVKTL